MPSLKFNFNKLLSFRELLLITILFFADFGIAQDFQKCDPYLNVHYSVENLNLFQSFVDHLEDIPEFYSIAQYTQNLGVKAYLYDESAIILLDYLRQIPKGEKLKDLMSIYPLDFVLKIVVDGPDQKVKIAAKSLQDRYGKVMQVIERRHLILPEAQSINQNIKSVSTIFDQALLQIGLKKDTKEIEYSLQSLSKNLSVPKKILNLLETRMLELEANVAAENIGSPQVLKQVIQSLVISFRHGLNISANDLNFIKKVSEAINKTQIIESNEFQEIQNAAKRLVTESTNLERSTAILDQVGLRRQLINLGDINESGSFAWFLQKEPLKSFQVGTGTGKTAAEEGISNISHETRRLDGFRSIGASFDDHPNALITREAGDGNFMGFPDETGRYGSGVYFCKGESSFWGIGLGFMMLLDPKARNGTDYTWTKTEDCFEVIIKNKAAVRILSKSELISTSGFFDLIRTGKAENLLKTYGPRNVFYVLNNLTPGTISDYLERQLGSPTAANFQNLNKFILNLQDYGKLIKPYGKDYFDLYQLNLKLGLQDFLDRIKQSYPNNSIAQSFYQDRQKQL